MYATIGFLFFYTLSNTIGTEQKPKEKIINFTLSEYVPEVMSPVEEIVEPEPEPIVEEVKPEPVVKKIVPKSKPIVKKKIVKKVKKKKRVVKKKKRVKKKVSKKRSKQKKSNKKRVSSKTKTSLAKKNRFLNQLRAKINKNKNYPRIAQRRGMQGSVKVKFTILANGRVSNIRVTGKKVFHKSARKAIQKSFPINAKNAPLSLPTTVNLTLRYQIR